MNQNYAYITSVIDKLVNSTTAGHKTWKEQCKGYLQAGKHLNSSVITVHEGAEPDCYDHWRNVFVYDIGLMHETGSYEDVELFHEGEDRPDTLIYRDEDGEVYYNSPYHYELCEFAGSAFKTSLSDTRKLFLTKLCCGGKMYYELYMTTLKVYEFEDEDEDNHDPYCVTHDVKYIATSCDEAMHSKLEALYNAAATSALLPQIDGELKVILDKML